MADEDLSQSESIILDVLMSNHGAIKSFEGLATSVLIFETKRLASNENLDLSPGAIRKVVSNMDEKGIITRKVNSDRKATYMISLPEDHESYTGGTHWTLEDIHALTGKKMNSRGGGENYVPELNPENEDSLSVFTDTTQSPKPALPSYEDLFDMIGQRIDADRTEREALEARNAELEASLQEAREEIERLTQMRENVASLLHEYDATAS